MALASDESGLVQAGVSFAGAEDALTDIVQDLQAAAVGRAQIGEDDVRHAELADALVAADIRPREQPPIESPLRELLHLTSPTSDDQDALRSTWSA